MTVRGLGTRFLSFKVDGVERKYEVSDVHIDFDELDLDWISFGDVEAGDDTSAKVAGTAIQEPGEATSLWTLVMEHSGTTKSCIIYPKSGTVSATNPAFGFDAVISKSGTMLGGEVDKSRSARWTFDFEWDIVPGTWTKITAP